MIESWMIEVVGVIGISISTYAVLRSRVARLEADYKEHIDQSEKRVIAIYAKIDSNHDTCEFRLNAGFKKLDIITKDVTILERDTSNLLDLPAAEARFVSKGELALHLEKIEIITSNTNKTVEQLMGKQDTILEILRGSDV